MKICHLTTVHNPFDTRIFHKECKTLVKEGHHVTLISPHEKKEVIEEVRMLPVPKAKNRFERTFKGGWILFRTALKEKAGLLSFS